MNSEKNQILAIAGIAGFILVCVVIFMVVGGDFLFLHAEGILGNVLWVVPVVMIAAQQIYIVPKYLKGYWELFSDDKPDAADIFVPIINECKIYPSDTIGKGINFLWVVAGALIGVNCLPLIGIDFIPSFIGSTFGGNAASSFLFYTIFVGIVVFVIISILRGIQYLSIRDDIYDLHTKYMGARGGAFSWFYRIFYFVPLVRSLSLLNDIQVLDKLTKFNSLDNMKIDLKED